MTSIGEECVCIGEGCAWRKWCELKTIVVSNC